MSLADKAFCSFDSVYLLRGRWQIPPLILFICQSVRPSIHPSNIYQAPTI